jgi:radical SAM protein with 4Fe4S-binding SPASM domain
MVLSPSETSEFFEIMLRSRKKRRLFSRSDETVTMRRALQFLKGDGCPYRCEAGRDLITVLADGTLVPCRRMPIPAGDLLQHDLVELYDTSPLFAELREKKTSIGCESCFYRADCNGGLRCLAHAMTGSFNQADPGCWLANRAETMISA